MTITKLRPACSHASHKLRSEDIAGKGRAVVCVEAIKKGEYIGTIGGQAMTLSDAMAMPQEERSQCLQVDDNIVLWISDFRETLADWINHSCDPNTGFAGQITLVAMRDIAPGEEVCFDYAMSDGSHIDEFPCACGALQCRGTVTGNDWKRTELRARYGSFFSPYLSRRIAAEDDASNTKQLLTA
jgi:hypothetical protein